MENNLSEVGAPSTSALSTQLASLPVVIEQVKGLAQRSEAAVTIKYSAIKQALDAAPRIVEEFGITIIDPAFLPDASITLYDGELNDTIIKCNDGVTWSKNIRTPFTKKFDEIRGEFTGAENKMAALAAEGNGIRKLLAAETYSRQQIVLNRQRRDQAKIAYRQAVKDAIKTGFQNYITERVAAMVKKYNDCADIAELQAYINQLAAYVPKLSAVPSYANIAHVQGRELIVEADINALRAECENEILHELDRAFQNVIIIEKDKLIQAAKTRVFDPINSEIDIPIEVPTESIAAAVEVISDDIQNEAVADTFNTVSELQPMPQTASGTKKKVKYNPTTHKAYVEIMKYWTSNHMHLLTVEELSKKLSFMVTAANGALNEGSAKLEAEGLFIVDDFSTRTSRK